MSLALELESVLAVEVTDADVDTLDEMKTPLDLVQFFRDRARVAGSSKDIEGEVLAALARVRGTTVNPLDLQLDFTDLFSVKAHP